MRKNRQIYIADENDTAQLRTLFNEVQRDDFYWVDNANIQEKDFDHVCEGEKVYICPMDNRIAGFVSVWEEDAFVHMLCVKKEYRKEGIAQQLIEYIDPLYEQDLTLKCITGNTTAVNFYLHHGWDIVEENQSEDGPYFLMKLKKHS